MLFCVKCNVRCVPVSMTSLYFAFVETMLCLATVGQWLAYVGHHGAGLAGATCSDAQKNECRRTVGGVIGDSGFLPSSSSSSSDLTAAAASAANVAGVCSRKQYVHFTHVCTVRNYMPNIDFCCCLAANWETGNDDDQTSSSSDNRLLCCRYHQGWNVFRCMDEDDAIETAGTASAGSGPSLWLILPPLLLPVGAVLVYCGIRCLVPKKRRRKCCFVRSGSSEDRAATNVNAINSGRIPPSSDCQQRKGSGDDDVDATADGSGCCCWGYDSPCTYSGYEMSSEAEECPVIRLQGCRELQELVPRDEYDLKHCFASEHGHPLGPTAVERGYHLQGNCASRSWCTSSGCTGCTGSYCSDMSSAEGALHRHLSVYQRQPYTLPSISGENRLSPSAPPSSPPDACPSSDYPLAATYLNGVDDCACNRRLDNSIAPTLVTCSCAGIDETTTSCPGCGNRRRRDDLLPVAPPSYDDCVPL